MKNSFYQIIFSAFVLQLCHVSFSQNVGVNATGATPDASAILDISSSDKGFLAPRMTQTQRNAITTPATGLLIFQTDNTPGFYYYDGSGWVQGVGATGSQGPQGNAGAAGATGAQGPAGSAGAQGSAGLAGATGAQGAAGATGSQGAAGATGAQGPAGAAGAQGPAGTAGATGAQGAAGAAGAQGPAGPAGATGAQGIAGTTGQSSNNYYTNATLNISGQGLYILPGFPVTITVPANSQTLVSYKLGGLGNCGAGRMDVALLVDGAIHPATYSSSSLGNNTLTNFQQVSSTVVLALSPGPHTISILAANSGLCNLAVGGNANDIRRGELNVTFIKQ